MRNKSKRKPRKNLRKKSSSSGIEFVSPDDIPDEWNSVFYGQSGSGKNTMLSTFPKPLLLIDVAERGQKSMKGIKGIKVMRAKTWQDLEDIYWYLTQNPDEFKTVGVDTITRAQTLLIDAKVGGETGTQITQRMWGIIGTELKNWLINMRDLDNVNTVFLAQERIFNTPDEDEEIDDTDDEDDVILPTVGPRVMPSVMSELCGAVDIVGMTFLKRKTITIKNKEKLKIQYCLRLGPHSRYITKIRKEKEIEVPRIVTNPSFKKLKEISKGAV